MPGATLIRAPPNDPSKSAIENVLELIRLSAIGPDIFTNTRYIDIDNWFHQLELANKRRELWHPPGARGIYGGAVIAQCLAAAQQTIPPPSEANGNAEFLIHSMHCYFVLAGDASIPILYHVERVRDGKSFMTRTVQARQKGKCIFTTTLSFMREGSCGEETIDHAWDLPEDALVKLKKLVGEDEASGDKDSEGLGVERSGPFISKKLGIENDGTQEIHLKKTRQWVKARGHISKHSGPQPHLSALAYMSDSYFIGTVARVHNLWRFAPPDNEKGTGTSQNPEIAKMEMEENTNAHRQRPRPHIGMMVSLDHTIYFHWPRAVKADDWLLAECESPWSGDGRGLVLQRIWNRDGVLVASCVQEVSKEFKLLRERSRLMSTFSPLEHTSGYANSSQGLVRLSQKQDGKSKL